MPTKSLKTFIQLMYGVSLLTGIGFTMSLFIGTLAFEHGNFEQTVSTRMGVFMGSFLSAVAGFLVLKYALNHMPEASSKTQPLPTSAAGS